MIRKKIKKAIIVAATASGVFCVACAGTPNLPVNNAFSGSWATIQVSSSYQYIGCIMKDIELQRHDDTAKTVPATFESHFFVDKSEPMDSLTKLLIVNFIKLKSPSHVYVREANYDNLKLANNNTVGITVVGDIEVPLVVRRQSSLSKQVYNFLKEKRYELVALNTFYTARFAKICSPDMKAEVFFMQIDNSQEQIIESAKIAFSFLKQ